MSPVGRQQYLVHLFVQVLGNPDLVCPYYTENLDFRFTTENRIHQRLISSNRAQIHPGTSKHSVGPVYNVIDLRTLYRGS
jgi:hypothetical protein